MSEHKEINKLTVITDTEVGYEKIGDIDGGCFDPDWLRNHIRQYGANGLLHKISYMNYQVYNMLRQVKDEIGNQPCTCTDKNGSGWPIYQDDR